MQEMVAHHLEGLLVYFEVGDRGAGLGNHPFSDLSLEPYERGQYSAAFLQQHLLVRPHMEWQRPTASGFVATLLTAWYGTPVSIFALLPGSRTHPFVFNPATPPLFIAGDGLGSLAAHANV